MACSEKPIGFWLLGLLDRGGLGYCEKVQIVGCEM